MNELEKWMSLHSGPLRGQRSQKRDYSEQLCVLQSWTEAKVGQKAEFNEGWGFIKNNTREGYKHHPEKGGSGCM